EIATAQAEKAANDEKVKAATEIAKKENAFKIQCAELQREADIKQAEADAAKAIEAENQRKSREIATADANLAKQEKEIELKERAVAVKERELEAEVKKTAEANKYAEQQAADAKLYKIQKESEAELFERERKAEAEKIEAEKRADAEKALAEAVKAKGLAEAEAARAKGEAEAAAVKAKLEAEAEGLLKKAEALKEYGDAAKQQQTLDAVTEYFRQLPAIAEAAGKAYTNVDKIYMYGDGGSKLTGNILNNITQISEGLGESLGIDVKTLMNSFVGNLAANKLQEKKIEDKPE
ncbi:MAG: flotillin domain-containing protein, partial [Alphaproteobacteria bacterium]|nr:flotillin domain-containing protein [Alphaproteobacteria bacterium]